jgi:hypothetical protein
MIGKERAVNIEMGYVSADDRFRFLASGAGSEFAEIQRLRRGDKFYS